MKINKEEGEARDDIDFNKEVDVRETKDKN